MNKRKKMHPRMAHPPGYTLPDPTNMSTAAVAHLDELASNIATALSPLRYKAVI